jgi:CxxC motif-containing protein (DUF1111 family)
VRSAPPARADFKLHDITDPSDRDAGEPLDISRPTSSPKFLQGNRRFLTRRLWSVGNSPPYFHHGLFTTIRDAIVAHAGEAVEERRAFERLTSFEQDSVVQSLTTLQVLSPEAASLTLDEASGAVRSSPH